jgi:hypothetical protein
LQSYIKLQLQINFTLPLQNYACIILLLVL